MKKYEVISMDAVQKTYIVEANSLDEAIDFVVEQEVIPVQEEIIFTEINDAKEIRYVN